MTGRSGRPRVVHVVVGDGFAGTERYVCTAAVECAMRGWAVAVVGGDPAQMRRALGDGGVRWLPGAGLRQAAKSLAALGRVDVVHAHMTAAETVSGVLRWHSRGRFVCTRHFAARRGSTYAARALSPVLNRLIHRQIAVSHFVAGLLDQRPDVVLHHGVRACAGEASRKSNRVLVLQRLEPEKDTATALQAWHLSELGGEGWTLRVAGRGQDLTSLQRLARTLGIEQSVDFLGFVDDPQAELAAAAVLVATAPAEPFGLSVLEAMCIGTPVVAAAGGGHLETVGAAPGALLFPPRDAAALAAMLRTVAQQPERLADYGAQLQRVQREQFDLDTHITRLLEVYTS